MDFNALYSLIFESFAGIGILVLAFLVISIIVSVILEYRTRRVYVDRGPADEDDDFMFFDDDDEDDGKD